MHKPAPRLFKRHPANPLLHAALWPYPVNSVFNAAAAQVGDETVLLTRVEDMRGISHLNVARSPDGVGGWRIDPTPTLMADPDKHPEEIWGIEDPRVVFLEEMNRWAVCYVAYSRGGPLVSLALTDDFRTFDRVGPITPPEDKDAALFPRKIGDRWVLVHRPITSFQGPEQHIWISHSPDLKHWGDHKILLHSRSGSWWDAYKIGLGPPPLETAEGWLMMYHGVRVTASGALYRAGLALLDIDDPTKVLRRTDEWVFAPREPYERYGDVGDVVFPCGWIYDEDQDRIRLYYGAADTCLALATAKMSDVLDYILACPKP
ncbi:MAG: glycosidase [Deltaproteobacteria bacterium]|nr:glycosidase [Deltaproteobacteria bacterium]